MKRRIIIVSILLFAFFAVGAVTIRSNFWASKNSDKYHYASCKWAKRVKPSNLIEFKTPEQAVQAGFKPCTVCKPPVSSKL